MDVYATRLNLTIAAYLDAFFHPMSLASSALAVLLWPFCLAAISASRALRWTLHQNAVRAD
jgi:hypothetical protein